ncbi:MAG: ribosome hibernation-promoting factor, HPF/YfiA family [Planctomycetota bacterium]
MAQVTLTARQVEVPKALREYVEEKAERLTRFEDRIRKVRVILEPDGGAFRAEMLVTMTRGAKIVGDATGTGFPEALDLAVDRVERQLAREKERLQEQRRKAGKTPAGAKRGKRS